MYDKSEKKKLEKLITKYFGKIKTTIKEAVEISGIEIALVSPTKNMPYYKLVTMGMGDKKMNVPTDFQGKAPERVELCFYFHETWDIGEIDKSMKYGWPVEVLQKLSAYPEKSGSWLAHGHTLNNNSPICDFVDYTAFLLLSAITASEFVPNCMVSPDKEVSFLLCYPIFTEELEFKNKNSALDLINRIDDADFPVVKNRRINYVL